MIVLPGNLPATGIVNLTLIIGTDAKLHIYQTGTTTDIVPPNVFTEVTSVSITGRDNYDEVLTIDFSGGNPIPSGGVSFNGGSLGGGSGNSLVVNGTSGSDSVAMSATQITVNGSAPISYSNTTFFGFNLGAGSDSLLVNQATLKISQDNAISAGTDVTIDGGTLDLNGKTDTIGSLLLISGSVLNGTLYADSYNIESGTVTAAIIGPGGLQKTTTGQADTGIVSASSVSVEAGQLTATSISTGTLTIGAGTTETIASITGGPLAANSTLIPLAASTLQPASLQAVSQAAANNPVSSSPAIVTVESGQEQSLSTRNGNFTSTPLLGPLRDELPSRASKFSKHATIPAINSRQALFAALQSNSRWSYLDTGADFDIAQHARAGKHSKQLEKAIDEILAEDEDAIPAKISV